MGNAASVTSKAALERVRGVWLLDPAVSRRCGWVQPGGRWSCISHRMSREMCGAHPSGKPFAFRWMNQAVRMTECFSSEGEVI